MTHPPKKRPRKISEAVFRGKQSQYSFDVFPLAGEFPDTPAVFMITRRKIDGLRNAHHAAICIGETESVKAELKKHKRAKCVKQNEASAVCIIREGEASVRAAIIDDLTGARSFSCIRGQLQAAEKPAAKAKARPLKAVTVKAKPVSKARPAAKKQPAPIHKAALHAAASKTSRGAVKAKTRQHRQAKQEKPASRSAKGRKGHRSAARTKIAA